jgi:hypothetical protein
MSSIAQALESVDPQPGQRILVTGEPAIRDASVKVLRALAPGAAIAQSAGESEEFDLLVHGLRDEEELQRSLAALRLDGEAYVLVTPGSHVVSLDLYPHIHRSSLRVSLRRVGGP